VELNMKITSMLALAVAIAAQAVTAAQLYRWVDEQGRVEWRDTPPPASAKQIEQRTISSNTIQTSTVPYSVQQAVKNYPVTLWVFDCGEPCKQAKAHLARRGVPHTQRDAQKESDQLKKLAGSLEVPLLLVGSTQLKGYLEETWDSALDSAGYPRTPFPGMKPQVKSGGASEAAAPVPSKDVPAKDASSASQ
jgi:hypothetical protein